MVKWMIFQWSFHLFLMNERIARDFESWEGPGASTNRSRALPESRQASEWHSKIHRLDQNWWIVKEPPFREDVRRWDHAAERNARSDRTCSVIRFADVIFFRQSGGHGLRDFGRKRRHRKTGQVPMEPTGRSSQYPGIKSKRGCSAGACYRGFPLGTLSGALRHSGEAQVHEGLSRQAAGNVAGSALSGGRKTSRPTVGSRRQISCQKEISAAANDLGRRAEDALLQRENQIAAQRMVPPGSVSEPG